MRALTIKQPFASWILGDLLLPEDNEFGPKSIENRGWATPYRGPLLIHAGATLHELAGDPKLYQSFPRSAILGVVDLVDVHHSDICHHDRVGSNPLCSPWAFPDSWHWKMISPTTFAEPISCSGALQVWDTSRLTERAQRLVEQQVIMHEAQPVTLVRSHGGSRGTVGPVHALGDDSNWTRCGVSMMARHHTALGRLGSITCNPCKRIAREAGRC